MVEATAARPSGAPCLKTLSTGASWIFHSKTAAAAEAAEAALESRDAATALPQSQASSRKPPTTTARSSIPLVHSHTEDALASAGEM
jgi:hypothetical protein